MRLSKEERENYQKKEPIAVYCRSAWGGIAILDFICDTDDYIVWYNSEIDTKNKKIHISKIYDSGNESYFKPYGSMYVKLSECLKV